VYIKLDIYHFIKFEKNSTLHFEVPFIQTPKLFIQQTE